MIDILHLHRDGSHVAFRSLTRPSEGTPISVHGITLLDGTHPINGQPIVCGTCGEKCDPADLIPEGGFA